MGSWVLPWVHTRDCHGLPARNPRTNSVSSLPHSGIDSRFLAFAAVSLLLIMTPGPDMALVTRNALASGRHAASVTALGVAVGIFGWAIAVAAGIGVLLDRSVIARHGDVLSPFLAP